MQHIWSILCHKASVDSATNSLSIFDCLEQVDVTLDKDQINKNEKVGIPMDFELVQFWKDEDINIDRKFEVKVELRDSDNNILQEFPAELALKKGIKRFRNRMCIKGFPITTEGEYNFVAYLKEKGRYKEVGNTPIDIVLKYKILDIKK